MIGGAMMKQAIIALNDSMKQLGREVNVAEIADIVQQHAIATSAAAVASGAIPGAGGVVALGIASASTATMYGRLGAAMGVRLHNGVLKAVASAVIADLAGALAVSVAATAAISFIPFFGNMSAAAITGITNYCFIYLAALIFIKVIAGLGVTRIETMSADEIKRAAHCAKEAMNMKDAIREARNNYKSKSKD